MVKDALFAINPRKYTGKDNLDPFIQRLSAEMIVEQITRNFNLSISSRIFLKAWKTACVITLHKGGDKRNVNNHRPITELSGKGKRRKVFLSTTSILRPFQPGFRAGYSTVTAVTVVLNDVRTINDRNDQL